MDKYAYNSRGISIGAPCTMHHAPCSQIQLSYPLTVHSAKAFLSSSTDSGEKNDVYISCSVGGSYYRSQTAGVRVTKITTVNSCQSKA